MIGDAVPEVQGAVIGALIVGSAGLALSYIMWREDAKWTFALAGAGIGAGIGFIHGKTMKDVEGLFKTKQVTSGYYPRASFG